MSLCGLLLLMRKFTFDPSGKFSWKRNREEFHQAVNICMCTPFHVFTRLSVHHNAAQSDRCHFTTCKRLILHNVTRLVRGLLMPGRHHRVWRGFCSYLANRWKQCLPLRQDWCNLVRPVIHPFISYYELTFIGNPSALLSRAEGVLFFSGHLIFGFSCKANILGYFSQKDVLLCFFLLFEWSTGVFHNTVNFWAASSKYFNFMIFSFFSLFKCSTISIQYLEIV